MPQLKRKRTKPALHVVDNIDSLVAEHVKKTHEALAAIREESNDMCARPRPTYSLFKTESRKRAIRAIEAAIDQDHSLTAVSVHAETFGEEKEFSFVVKTWAIVAPRERYTPEAIRAHILWGRAMGLEFIGWQTDTIRGG